MRKHQGEAIDPQSQTDTFAALRFHVDTWRWGDVPFYLRSGKAMASKKTEMPSTSSPRRMPYSGSIAGFLWAIAREPIKR